MEEKGTFRNELYVIDKNYHLIHGNESICACHPEMKPGKLCYQALMGRDTPCPHCFIAGNSNKDSSVYYDPSNGLWMENLFAEVGDGTFAVTRRPAAKNAPMVYSLADRDEYLPLVFESMPGGYFRTEAKKRYPFTYISERFLSEVGFTREEIRERFNNELNSMMLENDGTPRRELDPSKMIGTGNQTATTVMKIQGKDGVRWVDCTVSFVDLGDDSFIHGTIANVTNFVETQEQTQHQMEELLLELKMVAAAVDIVYPRANAVNLTKDTWKNLSMDRFMNDIIKGHERFSEIIRAAALLVPEGEQRDHYLACFERDNQIAAYRRGQKMISYQHQQMDVDGKLHWMETMVIFVDSGTEDVCQIALSRYVDDRMEEQEKLREAMKAAKKAQEAARMANEAKTDFFFNMSHDIRTPMNAIIGFTTLLKKHLADPVKAADYISKVESASDYMLSLINNVLEMARIESGHMSLDMVEMNSREFIQGVMVVFEESMREKGLSLVHTTNIEHPDIYVDEVKMREVFLNLLSNAIKYTPEGGTITIHTDELPGDRDGWCIYRTRVSDTGIGMSADFLPHIFDDFTREKSTTENRISGTGLGMPITKKLIELMRGTIEVESEPGRGTTFTISVPTRIVEQAERENVREEVLEGESLSQLQGRHILMAEDNDLNAEIAMELLGDLGVTVDRAEDGIVCMDMLQKAAAGTYDLILMDIQMPNMDGYKTTISIRGLEDPAKASIPIVAMTANAFDEDKKKALEVGMNGHVAKPIDIQELVRTIISQWT